MLKINGAANVEFTVQELAMLADMVHGEIMAVYAAGDEPAETALAVSRKVIILHAIAQGSSQGAMPRGGDFLDPRAAAVERVQRILREDQENTTACALTRA